VELVRGDVSSFTTMRDPEGMQLVLRNLLDNAVKYSTHGQRVTVDLRIDGDRARLAVRDTGAGMDQAALAHAFDPFWRSPDPARGGTGLGLHLVRETVRAHGGTVQASSEGPGKGTTVVIELPRKEAA
jgi:signal transduction histidine kinase